MAKPSEVLLVSMPFGAINRPALGASILKAALEREELGCHVLYPCLEFARDIGLAWYREFLNGYGGTLLGEWVFASACFRDAAPSDDYAATAARALGKARASRTFAQQLRKFLPRLPAKATALVDRAAHEVLTHKPRIVGCTSTFEQHVASLALLRRVKELDPSIVTCIGGSNCEGPMGRATLAVAPWVDYAVSGEADALIVPFVRAALDHGAAIPRCALPYGVMARSNRLQLCNAIPRAIIDDLDATPPPNFDDFFEQYRSASDLGEDGAVLPVETARGCWWGEKSHCTFCGLLGQGMRFREKSQPRCIDEVAWLVDRHRVNREPSVAPSGRPVIANGSRRPTISSRICALLSFSPSSDHRTA